jgi:hypothetical protein
MSHPRCWIALIGSGALALFAISWPPVTAQTYAVVLSVNDPRPMGEAVLSLIRSYPVTITYEDPRYEYSGDLRNVTRDGSKTSRPQVRMIVPRGRALQAAYDVSQATGAPVDIDDAVQKIIDSNNRAPSGGHFELRRRGDALHVVPTEVRDSNGRWIRQQSVLDVPITFSSGGERNFFELVDALIKEASGASGQKIVSAGLVAGSFACSRGCAEYNRTVEASNEPARDVLIRLLHSMNARYSWVLYYDPSMRCYFFNIVFGMERPEPKVEPYRPTPKPGDPTPIGVPFNVANAR